MHFLSVAGIFFFAYMSYCFHHEKLFLRFKSNPLVQMEPLVTSYTLLLQGLPGQGGHGKTLTGLGIKTNQRLLSVLRWISVRGCWTKKFGPLVVTQSLEFSRLPAMLSPLKTTLFPVPALTPRQLESAPIVRLRDTDCVKLD